MKINKIDYDVAVYDIEGYFLFSTDNKKQLHQLGLTTDQITYYKNYNANSVDVYQLRFLRKDLTGEHTLFPLRIGDISNLSNNNVLVAKYFNDRFICSYNSVAEASRKTKIAESLIHQSINKNCKTKNFNFKTIK